MAGILSTSASSDAIRSERKKLILEIIKKAADAGLPLAAEKILKDEKAADLIGEQFVVAVEMVEIAYRESRGKPINKKMIVVSLSKQFFISLSSTAKYLSDQELRCAIQWILSAISFADSAKNVIVASSTGVGTIFILVEGYSVLKEIYDIDKECKYSENFKKDFNSTGQRIYFEAIQAIQSGRL